MLGGIEHSRRGARRAGARPDGCSRASLALVTSSLGADKDVSFFAVLILILIFRPGLLGEKKKTKGVIQQASKR